MMQNILISFWKLQPFPRNASSIFSLFIAFFENQILKKIIGIMNLVNNYNSLFDSLKAYSKTITHSWNLLMIESCESPKE